MLSARDRKINGVKLVMLKHREYNPQMNALLSSTIKQGTVDKVQEVLNSGRLVGNELQTILANSMDNDISRGRMAGIANGWNTDRFSFLLVIEVFDHNGTLRGEEIYQGYTDNADTAGGNLMAGGSVRLDPMTMMYVNRVMTISYAVNGAGKLIPRFTGSSSLLSPEESYTGRNANNLTTVRPIDLTTTFLSNEIRDSLGTNVEFHNDTTILRSDSKFSRSRNDVGGRMMTDLIKAASNSTNAGIYSSSNMGEPVYESMISDLVESRYNTYSLLTKLESLTNRSNISNFRLGDLMRLLPMLSPIIHTVESYNDVVTRHTNTALNFNGDSDKGDSMIVDNQLTRFHKKVIPYMFHIMQSYGFIHFAGIITNKTLDGEIHIDHSLLLSVSDTVNNNPNVRGHLLNLFYTALSNAETKEILSGGIHQEVEMVFDLSLVDSIVSVNINGRQHKIRIPSMADSTFSSLIVNRNDTDILTQDLYSVVSGVMKLKDTKAPLTIGYEDLPYDYSNNVATPVKLTPAGASGFASGNNFIL